MTNPKDREFLPAIRRARFGQLDIYEVSDTELQLIERGAPDSIFLTFSVSLISTAISFLISLLTTQIDSNRIFILFASITLICFISGVVLLFIWTWHRKSRSDIFKEIRKRMPPEGISNIDNWIDGAAGDGDAVEKK